MSMTNKDKPVIFGSLNLNFGRQPRAHVEDVNEALRARAPQGQHAFGCAGLALQECISNLDRGIKVKTTRVHQPPKADGGPGTEAVAVRSGRGFTRLNQGTRIASYNRFNQEITQRQFPWVSGRGPNLPDTAIISVHMPPRRMHHTSLDEAYVKNLVELCEQFRRHDFEYIVLGDFNNKDDDPWGLERKLRADVVGTRIDRAFISRGLELHWWTEHYYKGRTDRHPLLRVAVSGKDKK